MWYFLNGCAVGVAVFPSGLLITECFKQNEALHQILLHKKQDKNPYPFILPFAHGSVENYPPNFKKNSQILKGPILTKTTSKPN